MAAVTDEAVQLLWQEFCQATGADQSSLTAVERFGDSAAMSDDLLALVMAGTKKATAGLVRDFEAHGQPLPEPGEHWIVLDGREEPRCVLRTIEIRTGLLGTVDDAFAWDEGEGDRTRDWWLDGHRRYFSRQGAREGFVFDEHSDLVFFERFELVWPEGIQEIAAAPA